LLISLYCFRFIKLFRQAFKVFLNDGFFNNEWLFHLCFDNDLLNLPSFWRFFKSFFFLALGLFLVLRNPGLMLLLTRRDIESFLIIGYGFIHLFHLSFCQRYSVNDDRLLFEWQIELDYFNFDLFFKILFDSFDLNCTNQLLIICRCLLFFFGRVVLLDKQLRRVASIPRLLIVFDGVLLLFERVVTHYTNDASRIANHPFLV